MLHFKLKSHPFLLSLCHHLRHLTTSPATELVAQTRQQPATTNPIRSVDRSQLMHVCKILFRKQNSTDAKLNGYLSSIAFHLTHEFFLEVCNIFPLSWKPVYRFHNFTQTQQPVFHHTPTTFNRMLKVVGRARHIDLLCELTLEAGKRQLVNTRTFIIVLRTLANARELNRCVEVFHIMNDFGYEFSLETLNTVVEHLCKSKLVDEANFVVKKLKDVIKPNGVTYKWLLYGFCDVGSTVEATMIWNLLVDEGFELEIDVVEMLIDRLFKDKSDVEALKLFQSMRLKRMDDLRLSSYNIVIKWLCKRGRVKESEMLLDEMQSRGIKADNGTWAPLVYGFLTEHSVNKAYEVVEGIEKPDISIFHAMITGLSSLKRVKDTTRVFREMIKRGCEPTMHTYIMLLKAHLGKRGGREGNDPLVNFETIFVGGLVKAGKTKEATKYTERILNRGQRVPKFDYNKFLYYFSNEEGVVMFEVMSKKLREVGYSDLADILQRYGERMTTRERRIISFCRDFKGKVPPVGTVTEFEIREQLAGGNVVSGELSNEQNMQQRSAKNSAQLGAISGAFSTQESKENVAKNGVQHLPKAVLDKNDEYDSRSTEFEIREQLAGGNVVSGELSNEKNMQKRSAENSAQSGAISGAFSTPEIKENVAKNGVQYLPKAVLDKNGEYDSCSTVSEDEEIVKISNLTLVRLNNWKKLWGRPPLDEGQFEALVAKLTREDGSGGKMCGYIRLRKLD